MQRNTRSVSPSSWWSSFWRGVSPRRPRRRRHSAWPCVNQLETRLTLSLSALASFTDSAGGSNPVAALITDSSGNLYGTASTGGSSNDGAVFELAKGTGTITTLASFSGTNGATPEAGLIMDSSGNLYSTTELGGAFNAGTIFKLTKGSGTITTLASFNGNDGRCPVGGLIMDGSGNLFGTTASTVFELAKGSGTITTLASFNGTNGTDPRDSLIIDSSGNLYGTAAQGGTTNDGTVFELARGSHTITALASFNGTDGADPTGSLIMDSSGTLYGTAIAGGAGNDGTVFDLVHGSGTITRLANCAGVAHPREAA